MGKSNILRKFRYFPIVGIKFSIIFGVVNLLAQPSSPIETSLSTGTISKNTHRHSHYGLREDIQHDDLHNEILIDFNYKVLSENIIHVTFHSGIPRCYGTRNILKEYDNEIGIAVIEGTIPNAPKFCTMEAGKGNFFLKTEKPIANRKIFKLSVMEIDLK